MMTRKDRARANRRRASEANTWAARHMTDEDWSPEEFAQWEDWMSNPDNSAEFESVVTFLERMGSLPMPPVSGDDEESRVPADSNRLESGGLEAAYAGNSPAPANASRFLAVAAALVVVGCLGYAGYLYLWASHPNRRPDTEQSYVTVPGQRLRVTLADGSVITMGGNTVIETRLSQQERLVVVDQGEALFQVKHDPQRTFRVVAQGGSITALGTEFDVRCYVGRVLVTVTRGAVEVGPRETNPDAAGENGSFDSSSGWIPVKVSSNQRMSYSTNGSASAAQPTDAFGATAWIDGELTYRHQPLREVVEDVQRMSRLHLEVDPTAAELPYTGTIRQESIDQWLKDLESIFPVKVTSHEHGPTLIALREPPMRAKSK